MMTKDDTIQYLVDTAAFVDRVDIGISGKIAADTVQGFVDRKSLPIGGRTSLYARALHLTDAATGQYVTLKYGRLKRNFKRVPEIKASFCSGRVPLSTAQVYSLLSRVTEGHLILNVSMVELTFDLSSHNVFEIFQQVRARSLPHSKYWHQGLETFYIGSRWSSWSLRVYRRRSGVTRIEFVFRRPFIRMHGISDLHQLVCLRTIHLRTLLRLCVFDSAAFDEAMQELPRRTARLLSRQVCCHPQIVERCLRREYRLDTARIFPPSQLETTMLRMQQNFIW